MKREEMSRSNAELNRFSELIGLIYEGATDPSRWTKDILPALSSYMQSPISWLFTTLHTPQTGGYLFNHGSNHDQLELYINKYQQHDVWIHAGLEQRVFFEGNVVTGDEMVPRQQLLESKIYKELLSKDDDDGQMMGGIIFGLDSTNSMPAVWVVRRGLSAPNYDHDDRAKMRLIMPHISRSLGVMQRLRCAELTVATTVAALDHLSHGLLLLNANGAVAFANRAAQRMLEDRDGLRLRKFTHTAGLGDLIADEAKNSRAIGDAISATLNCDPYDTPHFSTCVTVPRTSGVASYTLQFSALGDHCEFGSGSSAFVAIVFIADGAQEAHIDPALLQSAYGLTPAEARVALTLLASSSAQEVADKLGTSPNTVNTQIKQIYTKLGVDTRTRFVKLLLGLATHTDG
jgi:DNA-binding CsgD family transcriptional regulator